MSPSDRHTLARMMVVGAIMQLVCIYIASAAKQIITLYRAYCAVSAVAADVTTAALAGLDTTFA